MIEIDSSDSNKSPLGMQPLPSQSNTMPAKLFLPASSDPADVNALPDHMKALSVSPARPVHAKQMSNCAVTTVAHPVALPQEYVQSISPFNGLPIDCAPRQPYFNPWSTSYFIGKVTIRQRSLPPLDL
ncbi:hypothetical protein PISMIDRAFT_690513 [Pisolithus microcarpus 441]|uniref:Uncharacterized protein n=1 Tax=Pisolithus microcarpus 441 TaxID=765257 RepID=A0A0C9XFT8_9AGAM|nr:hypothetical protein PISMIDRAFT_690513 [Pisolithus microcarpus 441]